MTLIAIVIALAVGDRMRNGVFDSWQSLKPRDLSATEVRVVLIDDASIEAVGPWQWPRYYLARLTEQLAARGASVVAFDVLFPEHDRVTPESFVSLYPELTPGAAAEVRTLPPMDQLFGSVIGASPVVLAHAGVAEAPEGQSPLGASPVVGRLPPAVDSWPAELAAIPELDDVALGHGLINVRPDSDGVIRSVPLVLRAGGQARPGFAAEIVRVAYETEKVQASPSWIRVGGTRVPIDREGRMTLHFGRFPTDKIISAGLVLGESEIVADDIFAGKPVIIGVSAEGTSDIAATPIAAEEFGPLIQAQAVDAILRGGWLQRPRWAVPAEWASAALLALLALGNIVFGRANRIVLALTFAAVPAASWIAFSEWQLLLDPARPLLVGAGAVAGVTVGLFGLARVERERLRDALVQERVAAAETEGELQAARAIQLGMVPPRTRLHALDQRVDVDALLEPARSVGGDYYDAMMVGKDHLGFAIADVTGKGVPAALYMAMSKALTTAALSRTPIDLSGAAEAVNTELLRDNSEAMSVTMVLGILDLASGEVQLVCAGHEDPVLIDRNGSSRLLKLDGGPPFSITDFPYPVERFQMSTGDTLLLVTDGVTEAQNAKGDLFGRDAITVQAATADANAQVIVESVRDRVREFEAGTEATDDLTVMAIRYMGIVSGQSPPPAG